MLPLTSQTASTNVLAAVEQGLLFMGETFPCRMKMSRPSTRHFFTTHFRTQQQDHKDRHNDGAKLYIHKSSSVPNAGCLYLSQKRPGHKKEHQERVLAICMKLRQKVLKLCHSECTVLTTKSGFISRT